MFARRVALAICLTVIASFATAAAAAASPGKGAGRTFMYLVGYIRGYGLILNDLGNNRVIAVRPDGTHVRVLHKDAQATQIVDGLVEYFRPSQEDSTDRNYFFDLRNGHHGIVPRRWLSLTEGGGVWAAPRHNGWHLLYQPESLTHPRDFGVMSDLPNVHPMYFNFGASPRGLLVIASFKSDRRAMTEFYPVPNARAHHQLDLHGIPRSTFLLCPHVGNTIGCTDDVSGDQVIGLSRTRGHAPLVRHVKAAVGDVVFANSANGRPYAYTSLDHDSMDNGPECPCSIHFGTGGSARHLVDATIISHGAHDPAVFYVKRTAHGDALFRSHFGHGHAKRILLAPKVH